MVSWKGKCGKHIEECTKVEDVLSWGEGVCEEKPLRLVVGECFLISSRGPSVFNLNLSRSVIILTH